MKGARCRRAGGWLLLRREREASSSPSSDRYAAYRSYALVELGFDPLLERDQAQLREPLGLTLRPCLVRELGQRRGAPKLKRRAAELRRLSRTAGGERLVAPASERLEAITVQR